MSNSYHFHSFKQEFENSSIDQASNPKQLQSDELLNQQKDIFKKLKFIYLEQETRDKFLRKISDLVDIDEELDITGIQDENKKDKLVLKELKSLMNENSSKFIEIGEEVNKLYDSYMKKLTENQKLITEIESVEQEINNVLKEIRNK